jgi:hypothetical protein
VLEKPLALGINVTNTDRIDIAGAAAMRAILSPGHLRCPRQTACVLLFGSPLLAERAYFQLESPGVARLLVQLPIGLGDHCRPHRSIGIKIIERFLAFTLADAFADPLGIDAGINDEMGDMDVLGTEFPSGRLSHRPQTEISRWQRRQSRCRRASWL